MKNHSRRESPFERACASPSLTPSTRKTKVKIPYSESSRSSPRSISQTVPPSRVSQTRGRVGWADGWGGGRGAAAQDVPDGGDGRRRELGVHVVQQVEGGSSSFLHDPPVRGEQHQGEGLALAGRGDAPDLVRAPEDLELVALGAEQGHLAPALAVGHAVEGQGDGLLPLEAVGGRGAVAQLDRGKRQAGGG